MEEEILTTAKKHFAKLGMTIFLSIFLSTLFCNAVAQIAFHLWPEVAQGNITVQALVGLIPQYLICMPLIAYFLSRLPGKAPEKRHVGFGWLVIFFLISYACVYCLNLFGLGINFLLSQLLKGTNYSSYAVFDIITNGESWFVVLFAVIAAPIFEEFIFRKLLIDRCHAYGELISALMSGFVFAAFHGNISQGIYAFGLGFLFAIIYSKTGKIQITIGLHVLINFLGSVVASKVISLVDTDALSKIDTADMEQLMAFMETNGASLAIYFLYIIFLMVIVFAGIILLIIHRKKFFTMAPGEIVLPKGKRFSIVAVNVGTILLAVFTVVMFAINFMTA